MASRQVTGREEKILAIVSIENFRLTGLFECLELARVTVLHDVIPW